MNNGTNLITIMQHISDLGEHQFEVFLESYFVSLRFESWHKNPIKKADIFGIEFMITILYLACVATVVHYQTTEKGLCIQCVDAMLQFYFSAILHNSRNTFIKTYVFLTIDG